ncbi:MAG TPA: hypothetical protein VFG79_05485, partial [Solirubrobacter sp.]|nr:hypothetical protein [Solirubrobacter sp.]
MSVLMIRCVVVLAAVVLAACGSESEPAGSPASGGGAFPVAVEHKFGTTEIATEPKRVVTVGYTDQD